MSFNEADDGGTHYTAAIHSSVPSASEKKEKQNPDTSIRNL